MKVPPCGGSSSSRVSRRVEPIRGESAFGLGGCSSRASDHVSPASVETAIGTMLELWASSQERNNVPDASQVIDGSQHALPSRPPVAIDREAHDVPPSWLTPRNSEP